MSASDFPEHVEVVLAQHVVVSFECPTTKQQVTVLFGQPAWSNLPDGISFEGHCATEFYPASHEIMVKCSACIQGYHVISYK